MSVGVADVPTMITKLRNKAWLLCGKTKAGADKLAAALSGLTFIPDSTYFEVDRFWHMQGGLTKAQQDRIRVEEVFHMFTQWGYGLEWPKQFGTAKGTDWNESTLTKECRKAKCVWWQHPENNCPDQLASSDYKQAKCTNKDKCVGQCAETSCDCVEWYHQVRSTYTCHVWI